METLKSKEQIELFNTALESMRKYNGKLMVRGLQKVVYEKTGRSPEKELDRGVVEIVQFFKRNKIVEEYPSNGDGYCKLLPELSHLKSYDDYLAHIKKIKKTENKSNKLVILGIIATILAALIPIIWSLITKS